MVEDGGFLLLDIPSSSSWPSGYYHVYYKKNIPVKPDTKYAFGFSVSFSSETSSYVAPLNMIVTMYDKNGEVIGNKIGLPGGTKTPPGSANWYRYNASIITTSNTSYVKVDLFINHTVGKRNHFAFDSVMFFETDRDYYTYENNVYKTSDSDPSIPPFPFDDAAIGLLFKHDDETYDERRILTVGNHKFSDVVLHNSLSNTLYFSGSGTVSIEFREGRL